MPPELFEGPVKFLDAARATKLGIGPAVFQEISGGAIRFLGSHMEVDGEGSAADNLDNIYGGEVGDLLFLGPVTSSYNITVRHNGPGNIRCDGGSDRIIGANNRDMLVLMKRNPTGDASGEIWIEVSWIS